MATASHEHIPDLSASLSKSHHRAPISDLWGPSLSQKRPAEATSDYAMEIAMDTSRGPLMSSASSAISHDVLDESIPSTETTAIPIKSKVSSSLWPNAPVSMGGASGAPGAASAPRAPGPSVPTSNSPSVAPASSGSSGSLHLRSLATPNGSVYRPNPTGVAAAVNPVGPMGHLRSGIWGPRQNFGSFNGPAGFSQGSPSNGVYAKTPWSLDIGAQGAASPANSTPMNGPMNGLHSGGIAVPNQKISSIPSVSSPVNNITTAASVPVQPGFYGMPAAVSGSVPTGPSSLQNITPPHTSPSPPHMASAASRLYQSRGAPSVQGHTPTAAHISQPAHAQHSPHGSQQLRHHHHASQESSANGAHNRPPKKNGRPSTNTELYKTELCASYMSTGGNCPYGEKCQFAHGPEELKSVDRPPKWRSKPCQNWVKTGSCSYNERCCFRHDVPVGHGQQ